MIGSDGTDERNITNTPGQDLEPAWSPHGRHLAYLAGSKLAVLRIAGSEALDPPTLTQGFDSRSWAPDGTKFLVMTTDPYGGGMIFTIDAELPMPPVTVSVISHMGPGICPPTWHRLDP